MENRADARTNRARILDAADKVFGREGESASTEQVARLAGVGIATVFRHFPTKDALRIVFDGLAPQGHRHRPRPAEAGLPPDRFPHPSGNS